MSITGDLIVSLCIDSSNNERVFSLLFSLKQCAREFQNVNGNKNAFIAATRCIVLVRKMFDIDADNTIYSLVSAYRFPDVRVSFLNIDASGHNCYHGRSNRIIYGLRKSSNGCRK
jgi:hypothetical protein